MTWRGVAILHQQPNNDKILYCILKSTLHINIILSISDLIVNVTQTFIERVGWTNIFERHSAIAYI